MALLGPVFWVLAGAVGYIGVASIVGEAENGRLDTQRTQWRKEKRMQIQRSVPDKGLRQHSAEIPESREAVSAKTVHRLPHGFDDSFTITATTFHFRLHQKIDGKILSIHGFHATGGMLGVHTYYSTALTCSTTRHSLRLLAATQTDPRPIKDPLRR